MLATLLLVLLSDPSAGGVSERQPAQIAPLEALRERWRGKAPEERAILERHLSELKALEPAARARLLQRARTLRERERSLEGALSGAQRQEMQAEGPERRGELWRSYVREGVRAHGRQLRERLPGAVLERLERAPPEQRRRMLERLAEERERLSRQALRQLGVDLGLPAREVRRLERLAPPERLRELRELGRRAEREGRRARPPR